MMMRSLLHAARLLTFVCMLSAILGLAGCGDGAEELYETAQFEELQNNKAHARKLYERIIQDHADSPYAAEARERIAAMDKAATHAEPGTP